MRAMRPRGLSEAEAFEWFMPGGPPPADQCWMWTGSVSTPNGAGQFGMYANGRQYNCAAHRVAYTIYHGPVPPGLKVLHTCRKLGCCQPAHLFAGIRERKPHEPKVPLTTEQRFWRRVDKNGPVDPQSGTQCWVWQPLNTHWDGRPVVLCDVQFRVDGKPKSALRFSYELAGNEVPEHTGVRRSCRNRLCVNPDHARLGHARRRNGVTANEKRRREAAGRRIAAASAAIPAILAYELVDADRYLAVLGARIEMPHATLAELGQHLGMTKDAYAAALRRATQLPTRSPRA